MKVNLCVELWMFYNRVLLLFDLVLFVCVFKISFLSQVFGQEIRENLFQLSYIDIYVSEEILLCLKGPKHSFSCKKVRKT